MARLEFIVLGGLGAQIDSEAVELGTRKQRAVLAQLLLADGDPVSTGRLIDGIWGSAAPDRAEVSVQAYISGLRKALEPDRRPRTPSSVVLTRGTGYVLSADPDRVDVRLLVADIEKAHEQHKAGDSAGAATRLQSVLTRYRPLLPEFEGLGFRDESAAHLDRTIAEAQELSYEARLAIGEHRALVPELEQAVRRSPLDEGLWMLLAVARYRLGRQSEALGAIADARAILAAEIGVDPGPRLRALEHDILTHSPALDAPTGPTTLAATPTTSPHVDTPTTTTEAPLPEPDRELIGRLDELSVLHRAALASTTGPGGIVVVEGEPGAGKTTLLEEAARRATDATDLQVLWGRCVDDAAAPSMWPWVQVLGAVLPELDAEHRATLLDSDLGRMVTEDTTVIPPPREMPDATARFRFYGQAADLLGAVAESHRLVIVLDDLQWADNASLELLSHMISRRTPGVTFFVALRSSPSYRTPVANALASLARLPDHRRIEVGPLSDDDISALVLREAQAQPSADMLASIALRSGGNAFFVRELARILADRGSVDDQAVPAGIRDVVGERLRPLPPTTLTLLESASLIGRRVDIALLADAVGLAVGDTLDALDAAAAAGLIDLDPDDPFAFLFNHDLIREAVADRIPATRAYRLHLAIADQLATGRTPAMVAQYAAHLWAAGPLADRRRTARALFDAGRNALRSYSFDIAEQRLVNAATLARAVGDDSLELQVLTTRLADAVARTGYLSADPDLLVRTRELGEAAGDLALLTNLDFARFAAHSQIADIHASHRYAVDLAAAAVVSDDPRVIHLGMQAAGIDQFDRGHFGEAYRTLETYAPLTAPVDGLQPDQMMIARGFRALTATVHVGPDHGRDLFAQIDRGPADPMSHLGVAIFGATAAALAGDAAWAQEMGSRLLTGTAHESMAYLRHSGELMYWWARGVADPGGEALHRIDELLATSIPRFTGTGLWLALYAEVMIVAGRLEVARDLLTRAESFANRSGQHYPDAHRLLIAARYQSAAGSVAGEVIETLQAARRRAHEQEATTIAARIDAFAKHHGWSLDD
ncbi:BTAD domain-containing putative transcriptional regulator [Gordonia sp. NPDC003424]